MRCFIAIGISDEAKKEIKRIQDSLNSLKDAKMKLVEPENLHMTLEFLGELEDFKVNKCKEALKEIEFPKFMAHLGNAGVFPSESYIRVAWVSLEPQETIKRLHEKIHGSLKNIAGLDERFESHITLARIKFVEDRQEFAEKLKSQKIKQIEFLADSFALKKINTDTTRAGI